MDNDQAMLAALELSAKRREERRRFMKVAGASAVGLL
mgnify:CR=1 FL=1